MGEHHRTQLQRRPQHHRPPHPGRRSPPHLRTASDPWRRSGVQSSSAGTIMWSMPQQTRMAYGSSQGRTPCSPRETTAPGQLRSPSPHTQSSEASSTRGTRPRPPPPRPPPWPESSLVGRVTTEGWPCSACPGGSGGTGQPEVPRPGSGPSAPPTHKSKQALAHGRTAPPRTQQLLTCGYHAVHRILWRVDLNPPLKYPLLTTEQEIHQVRNSISKILAAAAVHSTFHLRTSRPT